MKCLHCQVEFYPNTISGNIYTKPTDEVNYGGGWDYEVTECPACHELNIYVIKYEDIYANSGNNDWIKVPVIKFPIWPKGTNRAPCPSEVPDYIAEDYNEACLVLADSPKASAALSRRCLQNMLEDAAHVKHSDLSKEIKEVIEGGKLPSHLVEMIDAVRNIGNFAAHPLKSQSSGMIVPVEPEEAEWGLEVFEALFDFYYVQPAKNARRRESMNKKLTDAGKPPMK